MATVSELTRLRRRRSRLFAWRKLHVYGASAGTAAALLWLCSVPSTEFKRLFFAFVNSQATTYRHHSIVTRIQLTMVDYIKLRYSKSLR